MSFLNHAVSNHLEIKNQHCCTIFSSYHFYLALQIRSERVNFKLANELLIFVNIEHRCYICQCLFSVSYRNKLVLIICSPVITKTKHLKWHCLKKFQFVGNIIAYFWINAVSWCKGNVIRIFTYVDRMENQDYLNTEAELLKDITETNVCNLF